MSAVRRREKVHYLPREREPRLALAAIPAKCKKLGAEEEGEKEIGQRGKEERGGDHAGTTLRRAFSRNAVIPRDSFETRASVAAGPGGLLYYLGHNGAAASLSPAYSASVTTCQTAAALNDGCLLYCFPSWRRLVSKGRRRRRDGGKNRREINILKKIRESFFLKISCD